MNLGMGGMLVPQQLLANSEESQTLIPFPGQLWLREGRYDADSHLDGYVGKAGSTLRGYFLLTCLYGY